MQTWREYFRDEKATLVFGVLKDKNASEIYRTLSNHRQILSSSPFFAANAQCRQKNSHKSFIGHARQRMRKLRLMRRSNPASGSRRIASSSPVRCISLAKCWPFCAANPPRTKSARSEL